MRPQLSRLKLWGPKPRMDTIVWSIIILDVTNLYLRWQKRKVLADPALPPEFKMALARSLRNDLFVQVVRLLECLRTLLLSNYTVNLHWLHYDRHIGVTETLFIDHIIIEYMALRNQPRSDLLNICNANHLKWDNFCYLCIVPIRIIAWTA